ncbi:MFS transporter [Exophiala viscosa]|uniref:MFS transporter n=1 Tax=Exophiala viscosa TaxID=2486360 RepID=A0AAN6E4D3_9EURO|nr:MFS transporter [Exophiala viscosa]
MEHPENANTMADVEKAEGHHQSTLDPIDYASSTTTAGSELQLEKAETAADRTYVPITTTTSNGRTVTRPAITKTRTGASVSDGYGVYNVDNGDEEDEGDNALAMKRTPTDAYEVRWDGKNDPMSPRNMSLARKWLITGILSFSSFLVTCASSIYTITYDQLIDHFHTSREVATLGLSSFVIGLALGPMFLAPLSEFYGRRPIYIISMIMFTIWLIPEAVAQGMATMIVGRFFDGFAGSAFLAVAAGSIVDLFEPSQIAFPMMIYTASPFLGPAAGPIIGGFINQFASWRWTFYTLLIWSGILTAAVIFLVPETFQKVLLKQKAVKKRKDTGNVRWWAPIEKNDASVLHTVLHSCITPCKLLILEPMCLFLCLYSAILLGIVYLFFGAFPLVFINNHGFSLYQVGLTFCGLGVGIIIGAMTNPYWNKNFARMVAKLEAETGEKGIKPPPEFRLPPAMLGAILVPIGLFWFGWTTYKSVHWIVPIIGSGFFGMGVFLAFTGVLTFLVDAYAKVAASAVAANVLVRLIAAASFPLFGTQMYENLGYQWASSLLAFLSLACLPMPFLFFKYGKKIRARSNFTNDE